MRENINLATEYIKDSRQLNALIKWSDFKEDFNRKFSKTKKQLIMKAYVYSGEVAQPDFKYNEESVYSLIDLIKVLPDSDVISCSVQDLKKLLGIQCESSMDFSLK